MEKKRMNDKGFSLVELIIVIAIMAILIGILAPQYLKFVERSRKSTDVTNVSEVIRAVEIYAADPMADNQFPGTFTITISTTASTIVANGDGTLGGTLTASTDDGRDFIRAALFDIGITEVKLKSSKWTDSKAVTIQFTEDASGAIKVTQTDTDKTAGCDIVTGTYK